MAVNQLIPFFLYILIFDQESIHFIILQTINILSFLQPYTIRFGSERKLWLPAAESIQTYEGKTQYSG